LDDGESVNIRLADDKKLPARFNHDKLFLISVNRVIPDAAVVRDELARLLAARGVLDQILFHSFGSAKPETVEVGIGKRVPVEVAQAVVKALAGRENLPVTVYVYKDDTISVENRRLYFAYTQRVIIGVINKPRGKPLSKEKAEALLVEGMTRERFFKLLSASN
jgi:hypothetical protein